MIYRTREELGFWEAWIEFDPLHAHDFGTLYVLGEVQTAKQARKPLLKKAVSSAGRGHQLVLEIDSCAICLGGRTRELIYSEPIRQINQYTSIAVYASGKLEALLGTIDIMI